MLAGGKTQKNQQLEVAWQMWWVWEVTLLPGYTCAAVAVRTGGFGRSHRDIYADAEKWEEQVEVVEIPLEPVEDAEIGTCCEKEI